ncbi:unnamed protein product [Aphanomyces euteiches]
MQVVVELCNVVFPYRSGSFRVCLSREGPSSRIWLESKQTKAQWECLVKDFKDHASLGSNYMLPDNIVLTYQEKKKEDLKMNGCSVGLRVTPSGSLEVILSLKAFRSLQTQYVFKMTPLEIEKLAMLEAKIRDLEETLKKKQSMPVFLSVGSSCVVLPGNSVSWNEKCACNPDYFDFAEDKTEISILHAGFYQLQMRGQFQGWNQGNASIRLLVDGVDVASADVTQALAAGISYMLHVQSKAKIKFLPLGGSNLERGSTLKIVLLHEIPTS